MKETLSPARVLVLAHSGLGDTLMLLPLLGALRRGWPEAEIGCTVRPLSREVLALAGVAATFIPWPEFWWRERKAVWAGLRAVYAFRPEVLLVPTGLGLRPAAWLARASRARLRVAALPNFEHHYQELSWWQRGAYTHVLPRRPDLHKVEQLLELLRPLGLTPVGPPVRLAPAAEVRAAAFRRLAAETGVDLERDKVLGLHLGCAAPLAAKLWPRARMLRVAQEVCRQRGMRGLVFWGADEEKETREALASAPDARLVTPVPWAASLAQTCALVSACALVLSNDSGVMHLAVTTGRPVLAVFGPTNPRFCGPWGPGGAAVFRCVECGPCYAAPRFYDCPHGWQCLLELDEETVLSAALRVLDGRLPAVEEEVSPGRFLLPARAVGASRAAPEAPQGAASHGASPVQRDA